MASERMINAMQALQDLGDMVAVPMKGGKSYTMVKDRIEIFRREFGEEFGIATTVDYNQGFKPGAAVVANATIIDKNERVLASGWAVEFVGSTKLTDASPVEVAETSAIGRALACFGLHGGEYASLNEIEAHGRKDDFRQGGPSQVSNAQPVQANRSGPNGTVDMGMVRQAAANRQQQPPPPSQQSQWYVPTDFSDCDMEGQKIVRQIEDIGTVHELGRYWSDLKPAIDGIKASEFGAEILAEIKAAFATRHNLLGAKR